MSDRLSIWAVETLRALVQGEYGGGRSLLVGEEAERVRCAYYQFWVDCGRPSTRLHARIARSLYTNRAIHKGMICPALAALLTGRRRSIQRRHRSRAQFQ